MELFQNTGTYGKVALLKEFDQLSLQKQAQTETESLNLPRRLLDLTLRLYSSLGQMADSEKNYSEKYTRQLAEHVVHGIVSPAEISALPPGVSREEQFQLASMLRYIADANRMLRYIADANRRNKEVVRDGEEKPQYNRGLFLSDFHEIIPIEVSSRLMYAAVDTEHSRSISRNNDVDTQQLAVETMVLLPTSTRHGIFAEMIKYDSSEERKAYDLFRLIINNFDSRSSQYCASQHIRNNLPEEVANNKIIEVRSDLGDLGDLVRGL